MAGNNLDDSAVLELAPGLRASSHLKRLSLSHNRIGGHGALSLATFLSHSADARPLFGSSSESEEPLSSSDSDSDAFSSDSDVGDKKQRRWKPSISVHTRHGDSSPSEQPSTTGDPDPFAPTRRSHHHFHRHRPGLNELDLSWNNVGGAGAAHLLAALAENSTLEVRRGNPPRSRSISSHVKLRRRCLTCHSTALELSVSQRLGACSSETARWRT